MSNINNIEKIISALNSLDITSAQESIDALIIMFEIDDKLRKMDKYILIKYLMNMNEKNLEDKQLFWNLYTKFITVKDNIINTILQDYEENEIIQICPNNFKKYIKRLYKRKGHIVRKKDKDTLSQIKIKKETISDKFYSSNNLDFAELLELAKEYVTLSEKEARLQNFDSALRQELFEDGLKDFCFDNLFSLYYKNQDIVDQIKNINSVQNHETPITIEEAKETILKVARDYLDEEYAQNVEAMLEDGNIDYLQRPKKDEGNSTNSWLGCTPKIIINYNDTLKDERILFHELGHAVHLKYHGYNDIVNYDYNTFLGEVVAMTNELLLLDYLKNTNLKDEAIKNEIELYNYLFIDAIESLMLEKYIHDNIDSLDINQIKKDEQYQVHIARVFSNYYDYKYALGMCLSISLFLKLKNNEITMQQYYNLLKSGANDDLETIFKQVDIDITNNENVESLIDSTYQYIGSLCSSFKKTSKKIV